MVSSTAVLDANVLVKAGPRDTLLRAAAQGLYRPLWSEAILGEVQRALIDLLKRHPDPAVRAQRLVDVLHAEFPEAVVEGYEPLIPAMTNDEKDRHVLAVAIVGRAEVIVTDNLRHFPTAALQPYGIEAQSPDTFMGRLFDLSPGTMVRILTEQGADLRQSRTLEQVLESLAPHVPRFVEAVRAYQQ